ncbi:MAG: glycosyltransferase family 2 protein [Acidobacteria bacterium]|nr:glycosyltransferase family 2 protein [Acidobacteriota bacterium]
MTLGVTISVVVCAYTEERWDLLTASLDSVLVQSRSPAEVVLVIDHNPALFERASAGLPEVRVIENSGSQGLSDARNSGVAAATGDVVAFLDDDAVAAPNWLERLTVPYDDPRVVAVGGRAMPEWETRKPGWFPEEFNWVVGCTYTGHRLEPGPVRNVIGCNMSLRRDVIESVGGFRSELGRIGTRPAGGEETELSIRAAGTRPDAIVWYEPDASVSHFVPAGRTSWSYFRRRCVAEGESKALITGLVGAHDSLATEWSYTLRVLPRGILAGIRQAITGRDPAGLVRALAIVAGFALTGIGYVRGRATLVLKRVRGRSSTAVSTTPPGRRDPDSEPQVTVIVATRDRTEKLRRCLQSVLELSYPLFDVVVVDNAPSSDETRRMVEDRYGDEPRVRYLRQDKLGLARAHNHGVEAAEGSILAFTDDDVVVDEEWLSNIVDAFGDPAVGCVTGRIAPLALETPSQRWLESYAGFSKGVERRVFDLNGHRPDDPLFPYTAGQLGSGANMAFRADVLEAMGGFDPALGAGSGAYGGDDLAAFFEVVTRGYRLVYEPAALVNHEHHRDEAALRRVMFGYGAGLTAYLTKTVIDRPSRILGLIGKVPRGLWYGLSSRSKRNRRRAADHPPSLRRREVLGMLVGPYAYLRSRRDALAVAKQG